MFPIWTGSNLLSSSSSLSPLFRWFLLLSKKGEDSYSKLYGSESSEKIYFMEYDSLPPSSSSSPLGFLPSPPHPPSPTPPPLPYFPFPKRSTRYPRLRLPPFLLLLPIFLSSFTFFPPLPSVGIRLTNRPLVAPVVEEIKGESISVCISCEL